MKFRKQKLDPADKAAEIKAKYLSKEENAKKKSLFTPAQEALMDELGLTPGSEKKSIEKPIKKKKTDKEKARSQMTARQLKLAKELGLFKEDD